MLKKVLIFLIFCSSFLRADEEVAPLISVGGGYYHAGSHSGGLFQAEYKWKKVYCHYFRPQACLIIPKFESLFVGVGVAFEIWAFDHFVFSPNFSPGLYYAGKGRKLGFPLEFRSSLEVAYVFDNQVRLGGQVWHISNASLGEHNPGANALTLFLAFPFPSLSS